MHKEALYSLNRGIINCIIIVSLIIPLVVLPDIELNSQLPVTEISDIDNISTLRNIPVQNNTELINDSFSITDHLPFLYFAGILFFLFPPIIGYSRIFRIIKRSDINNYADFKLAVSNEDIIAFNLGKYIVISNTDLKSNGDIILPHEKAHLKYKHSIDTIIWQIFRIIFWFNPFYILLQRNLRQIHEFQADRHTINSGIDATKYQITLLKKSVGKDSFLLANSLTHCQIKKRITMMNIKKPGKKASWKILIFLPIITLLLFSFSKDPVNNTDGIINEIQNQVQKKTKTKNDSIKQKTKAQINSGDSIKHANPNEPITIGGSLQITSGNPGVGKVLTSDGSGNARWENAASHTGALLVPNNLNGQINSGDSIKHANPNEPITIGGSLQITPAKPVPGYKLTSDESGNAAWEVDSSYSDPVKKHNTSKGQIINGTWVGKESPFSKSLLKDEIGNVVIPSTNDQGSWGQLKTGIIIEKDSLSNGFKIIQDKTTKNKKGNSVYIEPFGSELSTTAGTFVMGSYRKNHTIQFEKESHDFGIIIEGEKVSHTFRFKNTGKTDLIISRISSICKCVDAQWKKEPVPPGGIGEIKTTFKSKGKEGSNIIYLIVHSDPKASKDNVISIIAEVYSPKKNKNGILKGKVTDSKTNKPIQFATILLYQNNEQIKGASSNFDGNYLIPSVPAGKYTIKVSNKGYESYELNNFLIKSDKVDFQNFKLTSENNNTQKKGSILKKIKDKKNLAGKYY